MGIGSAGKRRNRSTRPRRIEAPEPDGACSISSQNGASSEPLSALERSVLLTVLYADLFDYALTRDELFERLVGIPSTAAHVDAAASRLCDSYLCAVENFVVWRGREDLIELRYRRRTASPGLWAAARRYSRWLARVPFVQMVAVSGSLAVENAEARSDVDFFCITKANRLWLARLFIVPLSKVTRRFPGHFPLYLCPNYILAMDALEVTEQNLFTAHEVAQAVPVWGVDVFQRFLYANRWVLEFLPNCKLGTSGEGRPHRSILQRAVEGLLRGRAGDGLNRLAHRVFVSFYRRRALRYDWDWPALAPAYRPERYTVPEGGYVRVVQRLYEQLVRERLGVPADEVAALFPNGDDRPPACYDWDGLFREEYGPTRASSVSVDAS